MSKNKSITLNLIKVNKGKIRSRSVAIKLELALDPLKVKPDSTLPETPKRTREKAKNPP